MKLNSLISIFRNDNTDGPIKLIRLKIYFLTVISLSVLVGCSDSNDTFEPTSSGSLAGPNLENVQAAQRWYSAAQVERGALVFTDNCAVCHGDLAQGLTENWRERMADGSFPPPPLNGSAHAWHHPLAQLTQTIDTGGEPFGGQMPPFEELLSDDDKLATIAFFQSFWDEEIYLGWLDLGGLD